MLSFPAAIKGVSRAVSRRDMRRSFDGLSMMAEHVIGCNPYAGHLPVFSSPANGPGENSLLGPERWEIWYNV